MKEISRRQFFKLAAGVATGLIGAGCEPSSGSNTGSASPAADNNCAWTNQGGFINIPEGCPLDRNHLTDTWHYRYCHQLWPEQNAPGSVCPHEAPYP